MKLRKLRKAYKRGYKYLFRNIRETGRFVYQRDSEGNPLKGKYNLLRHIGSLWALAKLSDDNISPVRLRKLRLGYDYILRHHLKAEDLAYRTGGIVNLGIVDKGQVKLGAHGLFLCLQLEMRRLGINLFPNTGWFIDSTERLFFNNERVNVYKSDISKLDWRTRVADEFKSEYYIGEYILAIASHGLLNSQAIQLCRYVYSSRDQKEQVPDHWIAQALPKIQFYDFQKAYANRIIKRILDRTDEYRDEKVFPNATTRAGCRLEALTSLYPLAHNPYEVLDECKIIARSLIKYQHESGGFMDKGVIQIDTTQHIINGLANYYNILKSL